MHYVLVEIGSGYGGSDRLIKVRSDPIEVTHLDPPMQYFGADEILHHGFVVADVELDAGVALVQTRASRAAPLHCSPR